MSSRVLAVIVACCGSLTFAAAASAATITVDPAAPAGCAGGVCKTITEAYVAAVNGDTISIKAGTFTESPLVITKQNLIFTAAEPGKVVITSSSTTAGADVITIGDGTGTNGDGTTLRGLAIKVQPDGGHAVLVRAKDTIVDQSSLLRQGANGQDVAAYEVADPVAGTNTVSATIVLNDPTSGADRAAAAVQGGDASSLVIVDSIVGAGARQRDAIALTGNMTGVANRLTRVGAFAAHAAGNALSILSAGTSAVPKLLVVDSSILSGGAGGAGLRAASTSTSAAATNVAGDITATLVHTTIAGSAAGVVIDAAANGPAIPSAMPKGSIDVNVDRSILHGTSSVANHDGTVLLSASNTARLDITTTDTPQQASSETGSTVTVAGTTNTPDAALFRNPAGRNYHLRADAPAIDKAGAAVSGESATDIDGEPRVSGAASDLGADEFVNRAPTARIAISKANPRENEKVIFDATKSTDPELGSGGGIAEYEWVFGDGTQQTTKTATVEHVFAKVGSYSATVTVVDNFGAKSAPSEPIAITVGDGTPPKIVVATPKAKQKIKIFRTVVKRTKAADGTVTRKTSQVRRTIRFFGTASDDVKLRGVALSLRRISVKRTPAKRSQAANCTFFDGKSKFVVRSCRKAPIYRATLKQGGIWSFRIKNTVKIRPGTYELTATAIDTNGNSSTPVKIRFTFV